MTSHPWDLSDRLVEALADCPSVCESLHLPGPVRLGLDAPAHGPPVHDRALPRAPGPDPRGRARHLALDRRDRRASAARPRPSTRPRCDLLRTVRFDQVFAAAYSERPGTPATKLADDVPAAEKRRRLVGLLGVQEAIGLERNRAWLGRTTEVLVDTIVPPRTHDHEDDEAEGDGAASPATRSRACPTGVAHLAGRSRENKLVHVAGSPALLGALVRVPDRPRRAVRPARPAGLSAA